MIDIRTFHDAPTQTLTYVVSDPATKTAVVIDPVLDYDPASSKITYDSVDQVSEHLRASELKLALILETHAHADHLSGSQILRRRFPGAKIAISRRIVEVQRVFREVFEFPAEFAADGSQFDRLLDDGEIVELGGLRFEVLFTPGHTPACASYRFEGAVFTGDALFMPDMGTGRCDFPAGSASDLYDSITQRLYTLPDTTRVFVGHDYQPGGRELAFESTVGAQKRDNIQLPASRSKADFIEFRTARDATLAAPRLLFQSVQVNVCAGALPAESDSSRRFLKIPLRTPE